MKKVIISLIFFLGGGLKAVVSKKTKETSALDSAVALLGDDLKLFPGYLWENRACYTSGARKVTCCGCLIHQSACIETKIVGNNDAFNFKFTFGDKTIIEMELKRPKTLITKALVKCGYMPRPAGLKMCNSWHQLLVFSDGYQFCSGLYAVYNRRKVMSVDLNCLRFRTDGAYRFETIDNRYVRGLVSPTEVSGWRPLSHTKSAKTCGETKEVQEDERGLDSATLLLGDDLTHFPRYLWDNGACSTSGDMKVTCCGCLIHQSACIMTEMVYHNTAFKLQFTFGDKIIIDMEFKRPESLITDSLVECGSMPRPAEVEMCSKLYGIYIFWDGYKYCGSLFAEYKGREVRSADLNCFRFRTDGTYRIESVDGRPVRSGGHTVDGWRPLRHTKSAKTCGETKPVQDDPRGLDSATRLLVDDLKLFPRYLWEIGACSTSGSMKVKCCGYLIKKSACIKTELEDDEFEFKFKIGDKKIFKMELKKPKKRRMTNALVECGSMPKHSGVKICGKWHSFSMFEDGYQFCSSLFVEYYGREVWSVDLNCFHYHIDGTYRIETVNGNPVLGGDEYGGWRSLIRKKKD